MRRAAFAVLLVVAGCNAILGLDAGDLVVTSSGGAGGAAGGGGGAAGAGGAQCEGVCAQHVAGWFGPLNAVFGGDCPPGYTDASDYVVVPTPLPMPDCACACGPATGTCSAQVSLFTDDSCLTVETSVNAAPDGSCAVGTGSIIASLSATHAPGANAACAPSATIATAPPPLTVAHACTRDLGDCGDDSCLSDDPPLSICIGVMGSGDCPEAYPNQSQFYVASSVVDTRGCGTGTCSCDYSGDADCLGKLRLYDTTSCSNLVGTIGLDAQCQPPPNPIVHGVEYEPFAVGTCLPGGAGVAEGSVTGTLATVCCQ